MAVVDSRYKFVLIDVGAEGRQSDPGVLKASAIGHHMESGSLDLPGMSLLPGTRIAAPHVFIGDEAFQLRPDFLRPYPARELTSEKRIFNFRLSSARNCVENAFGILAARWRILLQTMNLDPGHAENVVKATCILHNFLMEHFQLPEAYGDEVDCLGNVADGTWRTEVQGIQLDSLAPTHARNHSRTAVVCRETFTKYFCSRAGAVTYQWAKAGCSAPDWSS
ncbi:uncharacterized protein LOC135377435 [Ornithodoros turicata]|uniref:uncharacterized protein LOC135377435 n=1 Tax=Ornithodoros turicata TaxID=34597 RepID=UPI003139B734